MADSSQKFIARNRAPRVQIEYDVELYGAQKKVQLPFVMGVLSDLSGKSKAETPAVSDRKFLEIDVDNFDDRMKAMAPRVEFSVPNTLTGEGNLAVDLTFEKMADFNPAQIAAKIEPLRKLLDARTQLSTLMAYMDGKAGAETLIEKILADPALLSSLASSPVEVQDQQAALDALRDAAPEVAPQDHSVEDALASLPEAPSEERSDTSADVLSDLAATAPEDAPADTSLDDALASLPDAAEPSQVQDDASDVLSDLAATAPEDAVEDTSVQDALSSIPDAVPDEAIDETGTVLSDLADMAPEDVALDNGVDDALASVPELEVDEGEDGTSDILSDLADTAQVDEEEDTGIEDALSSLPDAPEPVEDDQSDVLGELADAAPEDEVSEDSDLDDLLGDLAEMATDEAAEEDETGDILAAMPEIEDIEETDEAEDILGDLANAAPEEETEDDLDDLLGDLADMAPDEVAEEDDTDDILTAMPEVEEIEETDEAEDILGDLADAAPEEEAEDDLDDLLGDLAEMAPDEAAEEDDTDDILTAMPEVEEIEETDEAEDILGELADAAPEEETDEDLDDLLGDLADMAPDEAAEEDDTDDILTAMPEVEEIEETDEAEDILGDLADTAPEEETDDDLDDLLGDLVDLAPDEVTEEDDTDDILTAMPEVEEADETDDAEDILGELADAAPEEETDDDLDDLLGDVADMAPDEEAEEDDADDILASVPDFEEAEDADDADDILGDLTIDDTDEDAETDGDLDDLLGDLEDAVSDDADESSDLDDLLGDLEEAEPEDAEDADDPLADLDTDELDADSDDELDDLLGDLDLDDEASTDDLDDLLNDDEEPVADDEDLDLDGLLDDLGADDDDAPEDAGDDSGLDDLDLDLDDLLGGDDDDAEESADLKDVAADEDLEQTESVEAPKGANSDGEPVLAFGKMSADRPDPERLKRTRFRIAIFGDFSGRAARGLIETGDALAARKPILLDPDTVEDVIQSFATTLVLPLGKDGAGVEVKLKELDDLHPDELYENVELFDGLSGLKSQLSSGATADHAAKQLIAWGEEFGQAVVPPRKTSGGNTVRADLKLSDFQKLIGDTSGELAQPSPVDDLLKRVVGPHIRKLPSPDVSAMQTAVDEALSAAMRMVLHHPEFQSVEAQWRSLDLIARSVEDDDTLDVILYDVSAEEIAADLAAEEDLAKTGLVRLLTEEPLDEENGRGGYSALIGLHTFEETPPHAELLGRIGRVAAHVDAPFISAITPAYLEIKKEDRHPLVTKAWDTFRAMPEAGHVGLASPRFLLRRPYGAKSEPIYEFDFEEFTETEGLRGMLWANPAVLVTILLARSFKQNGKAMNLGSVMSLGGIPFHFVNDRYGDQVALPCTERNITLEKHEHSVQRGYMPVLSVKGRDEIRLGSFNSVAGSEILGPWTGVPVPEPSPDVPPEPESEAPADDDDLDLDTDLDDDIDDLDLDDDDTSDDDDDDPEMAALLADLQGGGDAEAEEDDADDLDDFLSSFGDDDVDFGDGSEDGEEEMDPELAALLADL